jgi:hypothetical protein
MSNICVCPLCAGITTAEELEENDDCHCAECEQAYDNMLDELHMTLDRSDLTDDEYDAHNRRFEISRKDCNKGIIVGIDK